jgi:flagellar assembly factor FliW
MRPAILAGFCFFVIVTVFFSRAVTQASQMDIMMAQRRASLLERRFVEDGLMNINTAEQAEVGHEAVLEVTHEKTEAFPLTAFASPKDELLALISVSPFVSQSRRYMLTISSSLLPLQTLYLLLILNNPYLLNPSSTLIHPEQTLLKISNSSRKKQTPSTQSSYLVKCEILSIEKSKKY